MGKKKSAISIEEIRDFFKDHPEVNLHELDVRLMMKLIVNYLDQGITDSNGEPPEFIISSDMIFIAIDDKRFTLAIKDNTLYS